MSQENKAREFWLVHAGELKECPANTAFSTKYDADLCIDLIKRSNDPRITHVIEYSAYQSLLEAAMDMKAALLAKHKGVVGE